MSSDMVHSEGWKMKRLGEIANLNYGKGLRSDKREPGSVPVYSSAGVTGYHNVPLVNEPGIIVGRKGSVGTVYLSEEPFYCIDTAYYIKKSEVKCDFKFLYYLLQTLGLENMNQDSAVPGLNRDHAHSLTTFVPDDVTEQKRIATILSTLDEKIELNHKTNQTLEEIAQAIFKEWFIDFNYPGATGEMVDSHLGPIPKGWSLEKIGNILKTMLGGTPSTKRKEYWENGNIPWINSGKVNEFRIIEPTTYITEEALNSSNTKLLPKRTVVIAITGATLGQFSLLEIDACANQSVIGILENVSLPSEYIYLWIASNINNIISNQSGGAQQHINTNDVNNSLILIPDRQVLSKFYEVILPIFDRQSQLCFESASLTKIRDLLLPQLMKGNINL